MLPEPFIAELHKQRIPDADALLAALDTEPPVSVRFNPYKVRQAPEGESIPWNRYGSYLDRRPAFTQDPCFHAGAYYVQEASSMFVEHLYRQAAGSRERIRLLDLCASPGGKSTLYASSVGLGGLVVANETIRTRTAPLIENVRKWGLGNVVVTNNDPSHFADFREWFDVIAVDAPCSGEGMFRKDPQARAQWNMENVKLCAARQRRILSEIWGSLAVGGTLIYSTCTFNTLENEEIIAWLSEEYDCEPVSVDCPDEWGIVRGEVNGIACFRFFPHRVRGEGFFAAVLRKGGTAGAMKTARPRKRILGEVPKQTVKSLSDWVAQPEYMIFAQAGENVYGYYAEAFPAIKAIADNLTVLYSGICMGQLFSGKLKPDHALALFHDLNRNRIPAAEVSREEALRYLRKEVQTDIAAFREGLNAVLYQDMPIGWLKRIGQRSNNLYPKGQRILSQH